MTNTKFTRAQPQLCKVCVQFGAAYGEAHITGAGDGEPAADANPASHAVDNALPSHA